MRAYQTHFTCNVLNEVAIRLETDFATAYIVNHLLKLLIAVLGIMQILTILLFAYIRLVDEAGDAG